MVSGVDSRPTLFLTVGLPGVGKTTRAKELASTHRILRLTPDEWMAPLLVKATPMVAATSSRAE